VDPSRDDEARQPLAQSLRGVEAEYRLEYPVKCPNCAETLEVLVVVRLLRTAVNFTSTLPRRGRVIACPLCRGIVSAELAGFA
jgi:hypothetical protein